MGKFEVIQTSKAVSAYGGVGSILETRNGSIIVSPFDEWPYFQVLDSKFEQHNIVDDIRFKNRLNKYFLQLEHLVRIPINSLDKGWKLENQTNLISATYFPKWFYCNSCKKYNELKNWKNGWDENVKHKLPKDWNGLENENLFYPPKCFSCYLKNEDKKKKYYNLEQIRFVLTAPNGDICDVPWDRWALFQLLIKNMKNETESSDTDTSKEETVIFENISFPSNYRLEFITSEKIDTLSGIGLVIIDQEKNEQIGYVSLSGLFNIRFKKQDLYPNCEPQEKDILFKPVIRSSNSVYYSNILSSIYIPAVEEINERTLKIIKEEWEDEYTPRQISNNLKRHNNIEFTADRIEKLIANNFNIGEIIMAQSETEYRYDEYVYIKEKESSNRKDELIFNKVDSDYFQNDLIQSIYKMDKIKITSVQTSYTRQEPIPTDLFLADYEVDMVTAETILKKFTSKKGNLTKYLPAIENYGEGIFIDFNDDILIGWIEENPIITERISRILENNKRLEFGNQNSVELTPKYIMIHTFSHLIIKELEYLCGYPSTSLRERLYIDEGLKMNGVLIYTIAGSEGSYGGITSLCESDKIGKLVHSALIRAKDCATDPICYHSNGQGVSNLNLSACFSCSLLPETSCEMFNSYLDRRLLIDENYGFFRTLC